MTSDGAANNNKAPQQRRGSASAFDLRDHAGDPASVSPDFHAAIELIGRRWAGAILWSLRERPRYFAELTASVPGLSDRLASRRLRELESAGLVARSVSDGPPARVSYALTEKGRSLEPALSELADWARAWKLSS